MDCHWKAWTPAKTREKALRVAQPLLERLRADETSLRIEPYPKTNGHVLTFIVRVDDRAWADVILTELSAAQSLGNSWTIHGAIDEELQLTTNRVSVVGVSTLSCRIKRGNS